MEAILINENQIIIECYNIIIYMKHCVTTENNSVIRELKGE